MSAHNVELIPKIHKNKESSVVQIYDEHVTRRLKTDSVREHQPSDSQSVPPAKAGRRPWVWALLGAFSAVGIGVGVSHCSCSLSHESTEETLIEGRITYVTGHMAHTYVLRGNRRPGLGGLLTRQFQCTTVGRLV